MTSGERPPLVPWFRVEGVRNALSEKGALPDDLEDDYGSLRDALEQALRNLEPEQATSSAFSWILGYQPDPGELDFHARSIARQGGGVGHLLQNLLLKEESAPPGPPASETLDRIRARTGARQGPELPGPDESFAGEHEIARAILTRARGLDDPAFVALAFEAILGRPVDTAARDYYARRLSAGATNRPHVMRDLLWSEELRRHSADGADSTDLDNRRVEPTSTEAMARAWDTRADENAYFFIASGASTSEEEFRRSGKRELEEVVLDGVDLHPQSEALEIGCGVGRILVPLADRVRVAYGVDVSPAMIDKSRAYCAGKPGIRTTVTDGTLRAFEDSSIDFVFSYVVFQHIPDAGAIETYLREAARVLRPSGLLRFQVDGRWMLGRPRDTYDGVKLSGPAVRRMVAVAGLSLCGEWGEDTHYYWIDARKGPFDASARAQLVHRTFDREFLTRLFTNCGVENPRGLAHEVSDGTRSLRSAMAGPFSRLAVGHHEFVQESFSLLLGRAPRPDEVVFHVRALESGWADRDAILDSLVTCGQFRRLVQPIRAVGRPQR